MTFKTGDGNVIRLTIGNQRGGVGKTTTAVTLARLWAERGLRTLLVDADPQGSIGSILRVKPELYLNDFLWNKRRLADCVIRPIEAPGRPLQQSRHARSGTARHRDHRPRADLREHLPADRGRATTQS